MAKKIIALVAAIALVVCFAASAGAVSVATTTRYTNGTTDIEVNVTVTGVLEGTNVTYYAKNGSSNVYIDQAKADAEGAEFNFVTAAANLNSGVLVGYTNADDLEGATVKGHTVNYGTGSKIIPTEELTVSFPYTLTEGKLFSTVNVTAGTATVANAAYASGSVTVTFEAISSDVTLEVATEDAPQEVFTATAETIDAGAVYVEANDDYSAGIKIDGIVVDGKTEVDEDANADKEGDRKLTVIGKVNAAQAYGIIVSETAISSGNVDEATFATFDSYEGAIKNEETGVFAIQLIDISDEASAEAFVKKGVNYYTAVYAKDANGKYVITANANPVKAE